MLFNLLNKFIMVLSLIIMYVMYIKLCYYIIDVRYIYGKFMNYSHFIHIEYCNIHSIYFKIFDYSNAITISYNYCLLALSIQIIYVPIH